MKARIIFTLVILTAGISMAHSQQQWDPKAMAEREKTRIMEILPDLTDDQKLVVEEIYKSYEGKIMAIFASGDQDREKRRELFVAAREEQKELLKDILTEDQFNKVLEEISRNRRNNQQ